MVAIRGGVSSAQILFWNRQSSLRGAVRAMSELDNKFKQFKLGMPSDHVIVVCKKTGRRIKKAITYFPNEEGVDMHIIWQIGDIQLHFARRLQNGVECYRIIKMDDIKDGLPKSVGGTMEKTEVADVKR